MNPFYVSIIFMGIILILISMVWIAYDRKRSYDYDKRMDEKKNELAGIINDAEQMIEELNRFSDYVITKIDLKNEELSLNLNKLQAYDNKHVNYEASTQESPSVAVNASVIDLAADENIPAFIGRGDSYLDTLEVEDLAGFSEEAAAPPENVSENRLPLNARYREVLELAHKGMDYTEIARLLNMGKGEVQLVLGLNR